MKKYGAWERLKYRLDAMMARGNSGMIKMLLAVTLLVVLVIALLITLLTSPEERDFAGSLWDALASAVNAWMPYSDEGDVSYILLTALAAITGLLFTSILIGIFSSAVEEKVNGLKNGNSRVLEEDHIVVLGFTPGEYTLIKQLIATAHGEKRCILIVSDAERSETETYIRENVEIPKNIRLICRSLDTSDVAALEVCSLPACRTVVVNHPDDISTIKATLAACRVLSAQNADVKVVSTISTDAMVLPPEISNRMGLINVSVNDIIARVIAHSCTETGISAVYSDLFDIEGGTVQFLSLKQAVGMSFGEVLRTMDGAVPLGIRAGEENLLNPAPDTRLAPEDRLICWVEEGKTVSFAKDLYQNAPAPAGEVRGSAQTTVIIGVGPALTTIIRELPEQPNNIIVAAPGDVDRAAVEGMVGGRDDIALTFWEESIETPEGLLALIRDAQHVVILCDENGEAEDADILNILYYIKVSELKEREDLRFSVTLELQGEKNLQLIGEDCDTDFIVAPHIVSMFLAQLADHPEVVGVFKELLSNSGSEIHLKPAAILGRTGRIPCGEIRASLMQKGYLFLGVLSGSAPALNPPLAEELEITEETGLIVICGM